MTTDDLMTRLRDCATANAELGSRHRAALLREAADEVARLRATACATPDPRKCVLLWEADHQRRAIEEAGLTAEEFPWGCDAIEHVAASLAETRAEVAALKLRLERDAATYATMQKGMESQAELADGLKQRARTLEAENARLRHEGMEQLQAAADEIVRLKALVTDRNGLLSRMQHALCMNVTDGTDGDPVRWCENVVKEADALKERCRIAEGDAAGRAALLAEYTRLMVAHGAESEQASGFLGRHGHVPGLVGLAETAAQLRAALPATRGG